MYSHEQHLSATSSPTHLHEPQHLVDENVVVQRVEESIDDHYNHHHHHNQHQHRCSDDVGSAAFEGDSIYAVAHYGRIDGSDQLTLSFRGQVYVFDSVTPDKVEAVLLILGGHVGGSAPSSASQGPVLPHVSHMNQPDMMAFPARTSQPLRGIFK